MVSITVATALAALHPVLQGTLGAATAQLVFQLYVKSHNAPEERLNAWAFTLITGCALGAAFGASAAALSVGAALHTLALLAFNKELLAANKELLAANKELLAANKELREEKMLLTNNQELFKYTRFANFPYPLTVITEDTPPGFLAVTDLSIFSRWPHSPCVCTYVVHEGKKVLVPFEYHQDGTLSRSRSESFKLPVVLDPATGRAKVEISAELATHFAIAESCQDNMQVTVLQHYEPTPGKPNWGAPHCVGVFEDALYVTSNDYKCRHDINAEHWKALAQAPQNIKYTVAFGHIPDANEGEGTSPRKEGGLFLKIDGSIVRVPYFKPHNDEHNPGLYLKDAQGIWQRVGDRDTTDLSAQADELASRLGLRACLQLDQIKKTADWLKEHFDAMRSRICDDMQILDRSIKDDQEQASTPLTEEFIAGRISDLRENYEAILSKFEGELKSEIKQSKRLGAESGLLFTIKKKPPKTTTKITIYGRRDTLRPSISELEWQLISRINALELDLLDTILEDEPPERALTYGVVEGCWNQKITCLGVCLPLRDDLSEDLRKKRFIPLELSNKNLTLDISHRAITRVVDERPNPVRLIEDSSTGRLVLDREDYARLLDLYNRAADQIIQESNKHRAELEASLAAAAAAAAIEATDE